MGMSAVQNRSRFVTLSRSDPADWTHLPPLNEGAGTGNGQFSGVGESLCPTQLATVGGA
jgi:hypothetical protein